MSSEDDRVDGWSTTLWKSDTVRFVFDLLNVGNSNLYSKTTAEMNATGVVYTPGVCRGRAVPSGTLFGVHYILTGVGIQTLFVHWLGCGRPQIAGRADEDTPLFVCRY